MTRSNQMKRSIVFIFVLTMIAHTFAQKPNVTSHITMMSFDGKTKKVVLSIDRHFEAPNWSPDGEYLLLNSEGSLYRVPVEGGDPIKVNTGRIDNLNNDHAISSDGKQYVISAGHIYLLPATGGEPKRITQKTPSYFHGWSPDGKTLAYCAERGGKYDLYSISVDGGEEKQLTKDHGFNDGPDYSPDGRWIYFNSNRSGSMEIWRIPTGVENADSKAERITNDEYENWFPHPSPDGRWLLFLSYAKGTEGHPANQDVSLRIMPLPGDEYKGGEAKELVKLFGGQGTINVNSWSPDSEYFAYVSYSLADQN